MELWLIFEGFPKNTATHQMGIFCRVWVWFFHILLFLFKTLFPSFSLYCTGICSIH